MIERMTKEDFAKLFDINENDEINHFEEIVVQSGMSWYDLAKAQISTIKFIKRYNECNK